MYALVNDINAYPDFLRWCKKAEVHEQSPNHLTATIALEAGKIKQSFTTRNTMQPGHRIDMHLVEGPFKFLRGTWRFSDVDTQQCKIELNIEFEFKNKLLKLALNHTFNNIMNGMIDAFSQRACEVYGKR